MCVCPTLLLLLQNAEASQILEAEELTSDRGVAPTAPPRHTFPERGARTHSCPGPSRRRRHRLEPARVGEGNDEGNGQGKNEDEKLEDEEE